MINDTKQKRDSNKVENRTKPLDRTIILNWYHALEHTGGK